jgi:signal transduction histidine kinase
VEKHGGKIAVESRVGRGTTVTLRFPAVASGASGAA